MAVLMNGAVLLLIISLCSSQEVLPVQYTINPPGVSVNGSSPTGYCNGNSSASICSQPNTSVLFDGIPMADIDGNPMVDIDGSMWARQLLAINSTSVKITFKFTADLNPGISIAEVWLFNCPESGQGVSTIIFQNNQVMLTNTSCESLVRVCIPCTMNCNETSQELSINIMTDNSPILIAEIRLYSGNGSVSSSTAPPQTTLLDPTTSESRNDADLPTILPVVLSLFFILVSMMVAALFFLWRCYNKSHPPHIYEEPGLALKSAMQGENFASRPDQAVDQTYAQTETSIRSYMNTAEELKGEYAAVTSPDPQSVYTLAHSKENKQDSYNDSTNTYAVITNPDPQSVYTQVDTKSKQASATLYANIINPDPQNTYAQVTLK